MIIYKRFLTQVKSTFSHDSYRTINLALHTAHDLLKDHKRYDGSPMLHHSILLAQIVMDEIGMGRNSVVVSLLHDVARMNLMSIAEIGAQYGDTCAQMLQGMNNISGIDPKTSTLQADNFKELIVSYATDPRVILIKIADRLEVMRALSTFPAPKRTKKSWGTIHLYAPIAHKLGLYTIKSELEDLSLKYLEQDEYNSIVRKLKETETERREFIDKFNLPIIQKLDALGLNYKLKARTKSIYSIWRKMKKQKVPFEGVFDIFAIRIVLDCSEDIEKMQCWTTFSVVTDFYTPNPHRMRDWISIPKSNGYESLHSTVVTKEGKWVEVQIRTRRMDEIAERGVAAHWRYKGINNSAQTTESWLEKLRAVVETAGAENITEKFDFSVSSSEIFAFTPTGDIRKMPKGATLLDFAFDIHSNLGVNCIGGKVNGRNVPIKEKLKSGDIVEILTSKNQRPKTDWLSFVVSSKARNKIKLVLRENAAQAALLGREELERKLKNWKINISLDEAVNFLAKRLKLKTGLEVYAAIVNEDITMSEIKELLLKLVNGLILPNIVHPKSEKVPKTVVGTSDDALIVDQNLKNVDYKLGKCCNPIFGDSIFAFVTIGSGITIHRMDCPNALRLKERYPYRVLTATWQQAAGKSSFLCIIKIVMDDRQGIFNEVSELISKKLKINIRNANFTATNALAEGNLSIEVISASQIDMVIAHLKKLKGVIKVFRTNK